MVTLIKFVYPTVFKTVLRFPSLLLSIYFLVLIKQILSASFSLFTTLLTLHCKLVFLLFIFLLEPWNLNLSLSSKLILSLIIIIMIGSSYSHLRNTLTFAFWFTIIFLCNKKLKIHPLALISFPFTNLTLIFSSPLITKMTIKNLDYKPNISFCKLATSISLSVLYFFIWPIICSFDQLFKMIAFLMGSFYFW